MQMVVFQGLRWCFKAGFIVLRVWCGADPAWPSTATKSWHTRQVISQSGLSLSLSMPSKVCTLVQAYWDVCCLCAGPHVFTRQARAAYSCQRSVEGRYFKVLDAVLSTGFKTLKSNGAETLDAFHLLAPIDDG